MDEKLDKLDVLVFELKNQLNSVGIEAQVTRENIEGVPMSRIFVVAEKFHALQPSERQSLVWRIAERVVPYPGSLKITAIYTLTPDNYAPST